MRRGWKNSEELDGKSLGCLQESFNWNMDTKGGTGEGSGGIEENSNGSFYCLREYI